MFLDASAVVAIIDREPGWQELAMKIGDRSFVSPLARYEAVVALARIKSRPAERRPTAELLEAAKRVVDIFFAELGTAEIDLTPEICDAALDASARYGKIVGHPADLNMGDCFAYACARQFGVPLLYKGRDFAQTDLA